MIWKRPQKALYLLGHPGQFLEYWPAGRVAGDLAKTLVHLAKSSWCTWRKGKNRVANLLGCTQMTSHVCWGKTPTKDCFSSGCDLVGFCQVAQSKIYQKASRAAKSSQAGQLNKGKTARTLFLARSPEIRWGRRDLRDNYN